MSQVFNDGELRPVYYKIKTVNGKGQFRRAPFDVLMIGGAPHIMPRSEGLSDQSLTRVNADSQEDRDMWRNDFAYETLEPIIMEEHEMGDMSDSWKGMTAISNL